MILDQRSDIEQFFLEALEQVKEEKRRKLEAQKQARLQQTQSQKYTEAGMMMHGLQMEKTESESNLANQKITVELADLDWEDRERILRLLFSKMNTGQSATDWRELNGTNSQNGRSSAAATGLNQSFREQEEEDYGDEEGDAQIFDKTTVPADTANYNEYYD